jgi:hypothetical protein
MRLSKQGAKVAKAPAAALQRLYLLAFAAFRPLRRAVPEGQPAPTKVQLAARKHTFL